MLRDTEYVEVIYYLLKSSDKHHTSLCGPFKNRAASREYESTDRIKGRSLRIRAVGGVATRVNEQPSRSYQKCLNW